MSVFLVSVLMNLYIRFTGLTTRITIFGEERLPEPPFVYVFWHSRLALLSYSHRKRGVKVLLSTSRDGEIIWKIIKSLGFSCIRGTASKPGQARRAAVEMLGSLKKGDVVAITPDGPKGPPGVVKKGVPYLARKSGCPIVPISWDTARKKIMKSWDRLVLPLPFSKAAVAVGSPYYVPEDADEEKEALKIKHLIEEQDERASRLLRQI